MFIKPIRIFHSRKFIAVIITQFLFLHLFRRIRNDIRAIRLTCFGESPALFEIIILKMTLNNADNLLPISIDLRRPDSRHIQEFCQCRRSKMGNPSQGGIGKYHKRRLVNFACPFVSPRPQFTCKGCIGDFRRHSALTLPAEATTSGSGFFSYSKYSKQEENASSSTGQ